jgi:hypothetical protein
MDKCFKYSTVSLQILTHPPFMFMFHLPLYNRSRWKTWGWIMMNTWWVWMCVYTLWRCATRKHVSVHSLACCICSHMCCHLDRKEPLFIPENPSDERNFLHGSVRPNIMSMCWVFGRAIAQAVSRWLPTAAARGSSPGLVMWDLWWTKWRRGRFSPRTSVSPANLYSTNCPIIILIYHLRFVQ